MTPATTQQDADDVLELARECGVRISMETYAELIAFAAKVREREREACAMVCDTMPYGSLRGECANAIRSRGSK